MLCGWMTLNSTVNESTAIHPPMTVPYDEEALFYSKMTLGYHTNLNKNMN